MQLVQGSVKTLETVLCHTEPVKGFTVFDPCRLASSNLYNSCPQLRLHTVYLETACFGLLASQLGDS